MSSQRDAARTRVGAHGDRRQQPALRKTLSGIKSKMQLQRKRSSTDNEVDEEEWNQRMQTWEKKKTSLSGSDWDRSFHEAVHARLKGKKPWRTPICSNKASYCMAGRKANTPEDEDKCSRNSTAEFLHSDWEKVDTFRTDSEQKNDSTSNTKHEKDRTVTKMSLEVVGLKREISRMELDMTAFAHSEGSSQGLPTELSKNLTCLQKNAFKATIKIPDMAEKTDGVALTRTSSLTLADAKQSSTRFVKTVLSPIQSESDCSKRGAEEQSGDFQVEIVEVSSDEPNLSNKESKARLSMPSERSLVNMNIDEYEIKMKSLTSDSSQRLSEAPQEIKDLMKDNMAKLKNDEKSLNSSAQKSNSSSHTTLSNQTNVSPTIDKKKVNREEDQNSGIQQPNLKIKDCKKHRKKKVSRNDKKKDVTGPRKDCSSATQIKTSDEMIFCRAEPRQHGRSSGEPTINKEFNRKKSNIEGTRVNVDAKAKIRNDSVGHEFRLLTSTGSCSGRNTEHGFLGIHSTLTESSKLKVQDSQKFPSESIYHSTILNTKREEDRKSKETLCNNCSLTINSSKERTSLHAIFSSPDTEMFGSWKKPPARPDVFIPPVFSEDRVPGDSPMVDVECISEEPFELRTEARPLSDESLTLMLDESMETLSSNPEMWYKEFRHPVISSEDFELDQMKSDCYREVIIDRSACRSLYDGPYHAKISKCCVRRYEVCHDSSQCSMRDTKRQLHHADYQTVHGTSE